MALYVVIVVAVLSVLIIPNLLSKSTTNTLTYNTFLTDLQNKSVKTATVDMSTGVITGELSNGGTYTAAGPNPIIDSEQTP